MKVTNLKQARTNKFFKKNILIILSIVISTNLSAQVSSEDLSKDDYFIEYITVMQDMNNHLMKTFSSDGLKQLPKMIQEIEDKNLNEDEQYVAIATIFKLQDSNSFRSFQKIIENDFVKLQGKYGLFFDKDIYVDESIFVKAATIILQKSFGCSHPWRYGFCTASVLFQGELLLAGCEAATGGIATPLCLSGAIAFGIDGVNDCYDKWCKYSN